MAYLLFLGLTLNPQIKPGGLIEQEDKGNNVCPDCGGELVVKVARRGKYSGEQFWGCSNFPKCRFKKGI